ncbi:hypothetical protein FPV67DRAFT_1666967 [Lyophyllum atratum]|nr:hypothetical protein FPV67DRAFT_1666967 [Lyophyllum atratum]
MLHRRESFSPTRSHRSKAVGLVLDTSDVVLSVLKDAARVAPIPYLQQSSALALGIGMRNNKDAFLRLANDACELVYAILCTPTGESPTPVYLDNLRGLTETLADIQQFAKKEASRTTILRMIKHKADLDAIKEYREKLRQSLDVFGLKSNISIHENLLRIEQMIAEMNHRQGQEELQREKLAMEEDKRRAETHRLEADERQRRTECERLEGERIATATHGQQRQDALEQWNCRLQPVSPSNPFNPFRQHQGLFLPSVHPMNSNWMSIGGNQDTYTDSVINTNSGNTTTSIVSDSNNDSSVRITGVVDEGGVRQPFLLSSTAIL